MYNIPAAQPLVVSVHDKITNVLTISHYKV